MDGFKGHEFSLELSAQKRFDTSPFGVKKPARAYNPHVKIMRNTKSTRCKQSPRTMEGNTVAEAIEVPARRRQTRQNNQAKATRRPDSHRLEKGGRSGPLRKNAIFRQSLSHRWFRRSNDFVWRLSPWDREELQDSFRENLGRTSKTSSREFKLRWRQCARATLERGRNEGVKELRVIDPSAHRAPAKSERLVEYYSAQW